jgi:hypothetical protein
MHELYITFESLGLLDVCPEIIFPQQHISAELELDDRSAEYNMEIPPAPQFTKLPLTLNAGIIECIFDTFCSNDNSELHYGRVKHHSTKNYGMLAALCQRPFFAILGAAAFMVS